MASELEALILPPKRLDERGRCCGRRPHPYKRPFPHSCCLKCDAQFDAAGNQTENWAFRPCAGGFAFKMPHMEAEYRAADLLKEETGG